MAEAYPNTSTNWFALRVKPQHEKAVAKQLANRFLEVFLPLYRSRRRWSDRVKTIELPLFAPYVFSRFRYEDRLKVLGISSVLSIVGFGGRPAPVSEEEIELMKLLTSQNNLIRPWPFLRLGQRVRVRDGPMTGVEGVLVREKTACRMVVNIHILQRAVAVELERESLERIVDSEPSTQMVRKPAIVNCRAAF